MRFSPTLSIVVTSRSDGHGGDMLQRMQLFVRGLLYQTRKFGLKTELIFVEWNPPADRPPLADVLPKPGAEDCLLIRYIRVPAAEHAKYPRGKVIPLYQMIAKNVGIRRARAEFVLCTNVDLLFSDALIKAMQPGQLRPDRFYRANRCDVPSSIDYQAPIPALLDWCEKNMIRRYGYHRDYPLINLNELGWQNKGRFLLWYSSLWARRHRAKQEAADRAYYLLDKEACGDFTLMSKQAWEDIQGYLELDMYSIHIDTLGLAAAVARGYQQEILPRRACTYHVDHAQGWSSMSGVEKIKFSESRPGIGTDVVYEAAVQVMREKRRFDLNDPTWGMANLVLEEEEFWPA